MNTYYIKNHKTSEKAEVRAENAQEACEKKNWTTSDCDIREKEECRHEEVKDGWCSKCKLKVR